MNYRTYGGEACKSSDSLSARSLEIGNEFFPRALFAGRSSDTASRYRACLDRAGLRVITTGLQKQPGQHGS